MLENPENELTPPVPIEGEASSTGSVKMSAISAMKNIFFNPEMTFASFRIKPHFVTAGLILVILSTTFQIVLQERIGIERLLFEQLGAMGNPVNPTPDKVEQYVEIHNSLSSRIVRYLPVPIGLLIGIVAGGFFYWIGVRVFGKLITYKQALSLWVYSSFAPGLIFWALNFLVLFLKPVEELAYYEDRRGVIASSPSIFLNVKGFPALATVINTFDLFYFWGLVLSAIGVKVLSGLSAKSASILIISMALLGLTGRVVLAIVTRLPQ